MPSPLLPPSATNTDLTQRHVGEQPKKSKHYNTLGCWDFRGDPWRCAYRSSSVLFDRSHQHRLVPETLAPHQYLTHGRCFGKYRSNNLCTRKNLTLPPVSCTEPRHHRIYPPPRHPRPIHSWPAHKQTHSGLSEPCTHAARLLLRRRHYWRRPPPPPAPLQQEHYGVELLRPLFWPRLPQARGYKLPHYLLRWPR